jgi:hypothetical protein
MLQSDASFINMHGRYIPLRIGMNGYIFLFPALPMIPASKNRRTEQPNNRAMFNDQGSGINKESPWSLVGWTVDHCAVVNLSVFLFFGLYRFESRMTDGPIDRFAKGGRICSNGVTEQY